MASIGHILLGNHAVNHTKGLGPTSAFRRGPDLHPRDLDYAIHGGHTLETALGAASQSPPTQGGQYPYSSPVVARSSFQETRGPQLVTNSPGEWPRSAASFWETMRLTTPKGQHPLTPLVAARTSAPEIRIPWLTVDTLLELPSEAASRSSPM